MSSTDARSAGVAELFQKTLSAEAVVYSEALAERLGLNATDLLAVQLIAREGEATPGRLAELAGLTSGAITGVLDRLEKAGVAVREADPGDRRRVIVRLVPSRVEELVKALEPLAQATDRLLATYPPRERAAIVDYLGRAADTVAAETARLRAASRGGLIGDTYTAPVAGALRGRLVFASGGPRMSMNVAPFGPSASARITMETAASRLTFVGATEGDELIQARFEGALPDVRAADGIVTMRYRRQPFTSRRALVRLHGSLPWLIELSGGITDLAGSLAGVTLAGLELAGGANHIKLDLPAPSGTVAIRVMGVSSGVAFRRPKGVPVMLRLDGGISHLRLDDQRSGSIAGARTYVSGTFDTSPDRYEIAVLGGASDVRIGSI
jgi:DNA-binding MarR family transcriptional regulator